MEEKKQIPSDVKNLLLQEWGPTKKQLKQESGDSIIKANESSIWRSPRSVSVKNSSGARYTPL